MRELIALAALLQPGFFLFCPFVSVVSKTSTCYGQTHQYFYVTTCQNTDLMILPCQFFR